MKETCWFLTLARISHCIEVAEKCWATFCSCVDSRSGKRSHEKLFERVLDLLKACSPVLKTHSGYRISSNNIVKEKIYFIDFKKINKVCLKNCNFECFGWIKTCITCLVINPRKLRIIEINICCSYDYRESSVRRRHFRIAIIFWFHFGCFLVCWEVWQKPVLSFKIIGPTIYT